MPFSLNLPTNYIVIYGLIKNWEQLEQLERLRSEDTPRRLMITRTIESYWISPRED